MTGAASTRQSFLGAAAVVVDLLDHPALDARWNESSVLPELSTGALAAHLSRAVLQVERYLDAAATPAETGTVVTASEYFAFAEGIDDRSSPLSQAVVARGRAEAEAGAAGVRAAVRDTLDRLAQRLAVEPPDRLLIPLGVTMSLDEYLRTRLVEICVHVDDLALSLGLEAPTLPAQASATAVDVLVGVAVQRHGVASVLRALTRAERDQIGALRVF